MADCSRRPDRGRRLRLVLGAVLLEPLCARSVHADPLPEPPGDLDLAAGFTAATAPRRELTPSGGLSLRIRVTVAPWAFVGGQAGFELADDKSDPENSSAVTFASLGPSAGLQCQLSSGLTARARGLLEGVRAGNWPSDGGAADHYGLRVGYAGSLSLWLLRLWEHPTGLELTAAHRWARIDGDWGASVEVGLLLTAVLLPEPG